MKNNNTDFSARTKISRILFLFSFCFLFLQSYSANIETYNQEKTFTFEMWNKPVKEVLNYIEKNSQFIFFYYNNTIDIKRNVSLLPMIRDQSLHRTLCNRSNTYPQVKSNIFQYILIIPGN